MLFSDSFLWDRILGPILITTLAELIKALWANPGLLYHLFSVFSNKHHYNFTTNVCEKMSILYTELEFEPQPLGHESPPIATWPGLPPLLGLFVPTIKGYKTKRSLNYGLILFIGLSLRLSWIDWLHRTANYVAVVPRPSCIFTSCSFRLVCILTLCNVIWRWAFVSRKFRCPILHN